MHDFVQGHQYARDRVLITLGARPARGRVLRGREHLAVVVKLGEADHDASLASRSSLCIPGEAPQGVIDTRASVLLFADRGEALLFLGEGGVTSYSSGGTPTNLRLHITPPLPRALWLELIAHRVRPPEQSPAEALTQLTVSSTAEGRWMALESFLERWYGKRSPSAQRKPPGDAPPLLERLLLWVEEVPEIMVFNRLIAPERKDREDGRVVFLVENQGVYRWSTAPGGDDPPVWRQEPPATAWIEEPEPLSGFLIQAMLFEAVTGAPFGASGTQVSAPTRAAILERASPLPLKAWNWGSGRFYTRDGALVMTMEEDVWLAARTPLALSSFEDLVGEDWEYVVF